MSHKKNCHINDKFKSGLLMSDLPNLAPNQDPNILAAWGMTINEESIWIGSYGLLSNYDMKGKLLFNAIIPQVNGVTPFATGIIVNNTLGFILSNGPNVASAIILIATQQGAIFGYNPLVDPLNCILVIDNSLNGDVYTGITISNNYLCVANYSNNKIDVFDFNFVSVNVLPFVDLEVLNPLPVDVAPYNIVVIKGFVYVIYARMVDNTGSVPIPYQVTYISIFTKSGLFIKRFLNDHHSNSWAFLRVNYLDNDLHHKFLLGNYDGTISIYNKHGKKIDYIRDDCNCKLVIYGLKGLDICKYIYFSSNPISGFDDNELDQYHGNLGYLKQCVKVCNYYFCEKHCGIKHVHNYCCCRYSNCCKYKHDC